jgi:quaternary ammonium compound-resistance protein SugE
MHWIYLIIASTLEIAWIMSLKYSDGFTRIIPLIFYAISGFGSAYFLSLALRSIPLATAYAIWMGIAMIGTTIIGILFLKESTQIIRLLCMLLILCGVVGLRLTNST